MKTYIWDLDGTLIDSYDVIASAAYNTAKDAKIDINKEEVLRIVKQTSVTGFLNNISDKTGISMNNLVKTYRDYTHNNDYQINIMPNAKEVLEYLKNNGNKHYLYTHRGSSTKPILERLGIIDYFSDIITSEYGFKHKPSGEGIIYLINKYKLNPEDIYYVGDRSLDVLCAKDAKVKAILYLPEGSYVEPTGKEDIIIKDLKDLCK